MAGVYTHTFFRIGQVAGVGAWTCPAGMRAVVTSIVAANHTPNAQSAWVTIANEAVFTSNSQGAYTTQSLQLRQVAYAGQPIQSGITSPGMYMSVGGYLFHDDGSNPARGDLIFHEGDGLWVAGEDPLA